MTIAKAAETAKLTKKAIRYYEGVGLIEPKISENGYRDYSKEQIKQLSIIKTLRDLSFSIEEIKICLENENLLLSCFTSKSAKLQSDKEQLSSIIDFLDKFTTQNRSLSDITEFQEEVENLLKSRPKQLSMLLQQVFPGDFGELLALAYGQFLDEDLTCQEQKEAWDALVTELDDIDTIKVPKNLLLWARKNNDRDGIKNNYSRLKEEYNLSYEDFNETKKEKITNYLENSDEKVKSYSSQDMVMFLAKEGKPIVEVFGKYLPIISRKYQQFCLKQSRFMHDNPELIEKLKKK